MKRAILRNLILSGLLLSALSSFGQAAYLAGSSTAFADLNSTPSGSNLSVEMRLGEQVGIKTVQAKADYTSWFKFVSDNGNWDPQWGGDSEQTYSLNTYHEQTAIYVSRGSAYNLEIAVNNSSFYTFIVGQEEASDTDFSVLESNENPAAISSIQHTTVVLNEETTISLNLDREITTTVGSGAQYVILAYTSGGAYTTLSMSKSGTDYHVSIPASVNTQSATISYFAYTTPISTLKPGDVGFDFLTFAQSSIVSYTVGEIDPDPAITSPTIEAHHASINEDDFSDFASLYVSDIGGLSDDSDFEGEISYLWQQSPNGNNSWLAFSEGRKSDINNIRPISVGYYRCQLTRTSIASAMSTESISNVIQVTDEGGNSETITSNLPIVIVRTDSISFPDGFYFLGSNDNLVAAKEKISVDVKIIWDETSTDDISTTYTGSDLSDPNKLYYDKKARMNYRGSSSLSYDRKNYSFSVGDDSCTATGTWMTDKKKMFQLNETKDRQFILYAAAIDDSKMRNKLALDLYADMTGDWNSHSRYVRLFVDGEDLGVYLYMEKNKKETSRIQVEDDGYVFKLDKTLPDDRYTSTVGERATFITDETGTENISTFGLSIDHAFEVEYPEWDEEDFSVTEWNAKVTYLQDRFNTFETYLKNGNYTKVREYIDYESWADYFIITEYTKNADGYRISKWFSMETPTSPIKAAPLWDMELGLNNTNAFGYDDKDLGETSNLLVNNYSAHHDSFPIPFWWTGENSGQVGAGLLSDDCFKALVRQRWEMYRAEGGALHADNVQDKIQGMLTSLEENSADSDMSSWLSESNGRPSGLTSIFSDYPTYLSTASLDDKLEVELGSQQVFSVNVSASSAVNYQWYYSAIDDADQTAWTILPNTSATYQINSVAVANEGYYYCVVSSTVCDCISIVAKSRLSLVDVSQIIAFSDEPNQGTVEGAEDLYYQDGQVITLRAIAYEGYSFVQWSDGNTSEERDVTINGDAAYMASFVLITATEDLCANNKELVAYPNPVTNYLFVDLSQETNKTYAIYRTDGTCYKTGQLYLKNTIELSHFPSGLYILVIEGQSIKFSKQ